MKTANIQNLTLVRTALESLTDRRGGLPGLGVLYGPAGYGKTTALVAVANQTRAYYVQMRSAWNRKSLFQKILVEMGIPTTAPTKKKDAVGRALTITEMLDAICSQLAASRRPLMIDEFDHCTIGDGMVELVRDIYEGSQTPLILSGEELLPRKLARWERFHSRVLAWVPAAPVSLQDARELAPIYCDTPCADDFLKLLVDNADGSVRRVSVNLARAGEIAAAEGWRKIDSATWGDIPLYTGEAPSRKLPRRAG